MSSKGNKGKPQTKKCFVLYDQEGDVVQLFESSRLAARTVGLSHSTFEKAVVPKNADKDGDIFCEGFRFRVAFMDCVDGHLENCATCGKPGELVCCESAGQRSLAGKVGVKCPVAKESEGEAIVVSPAEAERVLAAVEKIIGGGHEEGEGGSNSSSSSSSASSAGDVWTRLENLETMCYGELPDGDFTSRLVNVAVDCRVDVHV